MYSPGYGSVLLPLEVYTPGIAVGLPSVCRSSLNPIAHCTPQSIYMRLPPPQCLQNMGTTHGRIWIGGGGLDPPFGPRCRLFNIGPKIGPPPESPLFCLETYGRPPPPLKILDPPLLPVSKQSETKWFGHSVVFYSIIIQIDLIILYVCLQKGKYYRAGQRKENRVLCDLITVSGSEGGDQPRRAIKNATTFQFSYWIRSA